MKATNIPSESLDPGLMLAAAFAAFLTGWAWPALAQFPDIESQTECPGCRAMLDASAEPPDTDPRPRLAGTWSSPLTTAEDPAWATQDFLCFVACTPEARATAAALANGPRITRLPTTELLPQVIGANVHEVMSLLTDSARHASTDLIAAAASGGMPASRPTCDPYGFATQVVSPLPLRIEQRAGRIVFHYEEFGAERTVLFDGRGDPSAPASLPLGLSRGRFEAGSFVVKTSDIPAGRFYDFFGGGRYSAKLRAIERYTTSDDGRWLNLTLQLEDPETLRAPLTLVKRWRRAPELEILPYSCDAISGQR